MCRQRTSPGVPRLLARVSLSGPVVAVVIADRSSQSPRTIGGEKLAMRLQTSPILSWIMGIAAMPMLSSCGLKNDIQAAAGGCDEFQAGGQAVASLDIDARVKAFAQASSELRDVSNGIKADVKLACIKIAKDLGETDRWSGDDSDGALSNAD